MLSPFFWLHGERFHWRYNYLGVFLCVIGIGSVVVVILGHIIYFLIGNGGGIV